MQPLGRLSVILALAWSLANCCIASDLGLIDANKVVPASHSSCAQLECDQWCDSCSSFLGCQCQSQNASPGFGYGHCLCTSPETCNCNQNCGCNGPCGCNADGHQSWLNGLRVGYDNGFVIATRQQRRLHTSNYPFRLQLNGWGQLRHSVTDYARPNRDLNQFQLKRGRIVFSGGAFNPNFSYLVQLDGRSSSGDDVRLLDYYLNFDIGHARLGLEKNSFIFRTGKYKMPFTMSRWLSGRDFEFADRSVSSMYFDVNRSFAWGLYGETDRFRFPIVWEAAIFNGLVTGGAETGSSGSLDDNFAYSARIYGYPIGNWGHGPLADFEWHEHLAMRTGMGFASTEIDRSGGTEFSSVRVVDSGETLSSILPPNIFGYSVQLYSVDASFKLRGWSTTMEYYFRNIGNFSGGRLPDLKDHGFWLQLGYFLVPNKLQLVSRWSRVVGNSGTLGQTQQSDDEVAGALTYYFRDNHAKFVVDMTRLSGAPINSSSLDISPGDRGWLFRSQIQFSF